MEALILLRYLTYISFCYRSGRINVVPPQPQIFFGRDSSLSHLLRLFETSRPKPVYVAILGSGGIGKTTLGLSLLHHPAIVNQFGDLRWFISCEGVFDAEGLRSTIANTFNINAKSLIPALRRLALSIKSDLIITLDNLETPWE